MMNTNKTTGKTELGDIVEHRCRQCGDYHTYKANIVTPAYGNTSKQVTGTRVDYEGACEANAISFWDRADLPEITTSLDTRISSLLASMELELDAATAYQNRPKGGQTTGPPSSAFTTTPPSAIIRIRRFIKNVRKEIDRS